jgi:hypothetical protein
VDLLPFVFFFFFAVCVLPVTPLFPDAEADPSDDKTPSALLEAAVPVPVATAVPVGLVFSTTAPLSTR